MTPISITMTSKATKSTKKGTMKPIIGFRSFAFVIFVMFVSFVIFVAGAVGRAQQPSFDQALASLKSPDARERLRAIERLRDARFPEAIAPVAPLIADIDDRVQLAALAAETVFFLAEGNVAKPSAVDLFVGAPFSTYAHRIPKELTDALLRAVSDDNRQVRLDAAYLLGAIAPQGVGDRALQGALQHPDAATRAAAARAIGRLGKRNLGDALVATMNDSDADARMAAMWALGELRFENAVQALADFSVHYGRSPAGLAALSSLARIGHGSSRPMFRQALTDKNADVRRLAAEGLGRSGDLTAVTQLEKVSVTDRDPLVQASALFALERLGRPSVSQLAIFLARDRMFTDVRRYLLECASPESLRPLLASPEPLVRRGVADVLGLVGRAPDLAAIDALRDDADASVRAAVDRARVRFRLRSVSPS